jgi:Protein of unknown function (DUF2497)
MVDELVSELIRPMRKTWLDENLPALVERLGIELISRAKRLKADQDDGMKANDLMRDFDEFCAQVKKLDAAGGIEKAASADTDDYRLALASFRAACERLIRAHRLAAGCTHDQGQPPPAPGVA